MNKKGKEGESMCVLVHHFFFFFFFFLEKN